MAVAMQKKMNELNGYWGKNFGLKSDLQIRIGINTGFCTVGNFGSEDRLDYTAVGATVNLASRLEGAAAPGSILVSEDTYLLVNSLFNFKEPREIGVKGLLRKIKLYEVEVTDIIKESNLKLSGGSFDISINKNLITEAELNEIKSALNRLEPSVKQ